MENPSNNSIDANLRQLIYASAFLREKFLNDTLGAHLASQDLASIYRSLTSHTMDRKIWMDTNWVNVKDKLGGLAKTGKGFSLTAWGEKTKQIQLDKRSLRGQVHNFKDATDVKWDEKQNACFSDWLRNKVQ
jgi:hypothetical protein